MLPSFHALRTRPFPGLGTIDEYNDACFIVRDANGQALAYVYFEDEPGRRAAAKLLTRGPAEVLSRSARPFYDLALQLGHGTRPAAWQLGDVGGDFGLP